jgi:VIT1/CCC1 family predicted Fe2+/Mn2+ transporter
VPVIFVGSLLSLAILGALAARAGGADMLKGALRVTLWSALAMALTMAIGSAFGALRYTAAWHV